MSTSTNTAAISADFIIIGAGIAAASAGYWLAPHGRVILLERESQPGYHSTGRSAALFMESYGTPQVRALTMASRGFLENPPPGFTTHPLLSPRGAMMVATPGQQAGLDEHWDVFRSVTPRAQKLDCAAVCAMVPVMRPEMVLGAVLEPDAADMDVHAIHQGYLRGLRQGGGKLVCDAPVTGLARLGGHWQVEAGGALYQAPVVLNAAGAWADEVGQLAGAARIGLQPRRRSAFIFHPPEGVLFAHWPLVAGVSENWYFKPDAGMLLGSPANADPMPPHDVQPEELDIATAIHRISEMTTLTIRRPTRTWAGLRSFVPDGEMVIGWDGRCEGFFWLAGQGGYGIQSAPGASELAASLLLAQKLPEELARQGVAVEALSPLRLR